MDVRTFLGYRFGPVPLKHGRRHTDPDVAERVTSPHTIAIGRGLRAVNR